MKKSFLTFAAIAVMLSFTSCKETPSESTESEEIKTEIPSEVTPVETETPEEEVDTIMAETEAVEEQMNEDPSI